MNFKCARCLCVKCAEHGKGCDSCNYCHSDIGECKECDNYIEKEISK